MIRCNQLLWRGGRRGFKHAGLSQFSPQQVPPYHSHDDDDRTRAALAVAGISSHIRLSREDDSGRGRRYWRFTD